MSSFAPFHVCASRHFDVMHDRYGHWAVADRDGSSGGVFLTQKAAVRFAVAEADGDRTHVHILRNARRGSGTQVAKATARTP